MRAGSVSLSRLHVQDRQCYCTTSPDGPVAAVIIEAACPSEKLLTRPLSVYDVAVLLSSVVATPQINITNQLAYVASPRLEASTTNARSVSVGFTGQIASSRLVG